MASPPNYWNFIPRVEGTILDVGAHVGGFALPVALRGYDVVAVEASARNLRSLLASAELNGCAARITPMQVAAWNEDTHLPWFESHQTGSRVSEESEILVPARRLSADVFEQRIGLVKIDVEGYEPQVLEGMTSLIERDRPYIVLEDHSRHPHLVGNPKSYRQAILLADYSWTPVDPFTNNCIQWLGRPK